MMKTYIIKTVGELTKFLQDFNPACFSFDTETTSLRQDELELEGISLCDGKKACYIYYNKELLPTIQSLFTNSNKKTIIAHNIVYDMRVLYKYNIYFPDAKIYDTMIASHLIDENSPNGLKHLAKIVLGKEEVLTYEQAYAKGGDTFAEYATNDAIWTWELCMKQQPYLRADPALAKLFRNIEMPFQFVLLEMALTGVACDLNKRHIIEEKVKEDIEASLIKLHDIMDLKYSVQADLLGNVTIIPAMNFNSPQQVADVIFNKRGLKIIERTPTGMPAVGAKTLETYKDDAFVSAYTNYKKQQKILTAFIEPMQGFVQSDGKIRPNFRDNGTKTGRLSCSEPNLQQLPQARIDPYGVRACFTVPKGYKMITCDYSGQEVRVMAQQSQDPVLIDALNKGQDMHLKVANQFYELGIPDEALFETHPDYEGYKKKFKNERTQAKVITFGLAYGKGAFGFAKDFNVSEEEAQGMIDKYFEGMPEMYKAIQKAHQEVKATGAVTSMAGRKRRFDKIVDDATGNSWYPKSALRQSFNFQIQGFSADMIRKAGIMVQRDSNPLWNLKAIMTVHDEFVYQVKEEYVNEASEYIKKQFESAVNFCVPVSADVDIGDHYGEAK